MSTDNAPTEYHELPTRMRLNTPETIETRLEKKNRYNLSIIMSVYIYIYIDTHDDVK